MSALTTSIYHCTGASNQYNKEKKEIKGNQIWKEEVKLSSFFPEDMTVRRKSNIIFKKLTGTNK